MARPSHTYVHYNAATRAIHPTPPHPLQRPFQRSAQPGVGSKSRRGSVSERGFNHLSPREFGWLFLAQAPFGMRPPWPTHPCQLRPQLQLRPLQIPMHFRLSFFAANARSALTAGAISRGQQSSTGYPFSSAAVILLIVSTNCRTSTLVMPLTPQISTLTLMARRIAQKYAAGESVAPPSTGMATEGAIYC